MQKLFILKRKKPLTSEEYEDFLGKLSDYRENFLNPSIKDLFFKKKRKFMFGRIKEEIIFIEFHENNFLGDGLKVASARQEAMKWLNENIVDKFSFTSVHYRNKRG